MASVKRKFTVTPDIDDDDIGSSSNGLSGKTVFEKYRATSSSHNSEKSSPNKKTQSDISTALSSNIQKVDGISKESSSAQTKDILENNVINTGQSSHVPNIKASSFNFNTGQKPGENDMAPPPKVQPPDPSTLPKKNKNSIIVSSKQRGNPILKYIRNVPWEYGEIVPDYQIGATSCALFLSLRYHNINPEYIHERIKQLGRSFELRLILVQVDVKDSRHAMKELARIAILSECTLICAWSAEEAGRYLETYKQYENKPAEALQERVDPGFDSKMTDCLTSIKSVNKTDVITLIATFGSLRNISQATKEEISLCPGIGPQKAERLINAFKEPFKRKMKILQEVDSAGKNPSIVT